MALLHPTTPTRARWRDAPEPRAVMAAPGSVAAARPRQPLSRHRRLLARGVPAMVGVALVVLLAAWVSEPNTITAAEVSRSAHDQVLRDVISRTGDFSMTVGRLDCVELEPGRGNCLADLRSKAHQADGLLVAVGYVVDPADGQLELLVKLP